MIDRANEVFTRVKKVVQPLCKDVGQSTEDTPSVLPYLDFNQADNPVHNRSVTLESIENAVVPMVELTVYTKGNGKLASGKKILGLADTEMQSMMFRRTFGPQKVVNAADTSVCRVISRYTRVIGKDDVL